MSDWATVATASRNATTYADTTVLPLTTYLYRVRTVNTAGNSAFWSNEAWAETANPPAAPTALTATPAWANQINLSWVDNSSSETAFSIFRKSGAGSWQLVAVAGRNSTAYKDRGLSPGAQYSYRIRATSNEGASGWSNEAGATTPPPAPPAPGGLSARLESPSVVRLAWSDNSSNETAFAIWRKVGFGDWARIAVVGPDTTQYIDRGLAANTIYTYRVRATNTSGASAWTNDASLITPPP